MDNIEHRIEQLHRSTSTETDRRILNDAFVALQTSLQTQKLGFRQWFVTSRLAKPLAAAAVILIAAGLFISVLDKDFDSVEDFYRNLGGVANICVSTFEPGQTSPIQQVWTSQDLKVRLFKTGIGDRARFALLDLANKVETTMYLSNVKTEPLTEEKLRDLRQSMKPSFALAPFFDTEDQKDFIYEIRRFEEERGLNPRPIGGYRYELKRAFVTWPAKEIGEDLDFYIGSYYFSGEDRSSVVSGWGYSRDLLKKWLSKTDEGLI